jgi:hypothetical protein
MHQTRYFPTAHPPGGQAPKPNHDRPRSVKGAARSRGAVRDDLTGDAQCQPQSGGRKTCFIKRVLVRDCGLRRNR